MKTIFQKHTSKFVANLLNGLGIIACVSLTACGEEKGNNDGDNNEVENLKSALKNKFGNLNDSEFEKIAKALKGQGKSIDDVNNMSADQLKDFLNLPGNVKNLTSKVTKKNEGENTKDIIKIENGKIYLDGIDYDLSDCKTWNRDFLLELNNKKLNKSNKTIEVQGQFSLEFTSYKKVKICDGKVILLMQKKILMVVILLLMDRI